MAENDRIAHPEMIESFREKSRLSCCGPDPKPWSSTMPEAWPVKANNSVVAGKVVNKSADQEILDHRPVAMKQHDPWGGRIPSVDVVETHAVAIDELADWWVPAFRQFGEEDVPDDEKDCQRDDDEGDFTGGHG